MVVAGLVTNSEVSERCVPALLCAHLPLALELAVWQGC